MRHLTPGQVVRLADRLLAADWSWTFDDLSTLAAAAGLSVGETIDDRTVAVELSEPAGFDGFVSLAEPTGPVEEVAIEVTEVIDEHDAADRRQLSSTFDAYVMAMRERLGAPSRTSSDHVAWDVEERTVQVRDLGVAIDVAVGPARGRPTDDRVATRWDDLATLLGAALGTLRDLDMVSLTVGEHVVLNASRTDVDLWLVAAGPDDEVDPVPLTEADEVTLGEIGFTAPVADAGRGPQRAGWWQRVSLPATHSTLRAAARALVTAARDVYGAGHPRDISWYGGALAPATVDALAATAMSRLDG